VYEIELVPSPLPIAVGAATDVADIA